MVDTQTGLAHAQVSAVHSIERACSFNVMMLSLEYTPKISGGVGTHVLELSTGLSHNGCRVTVLASSSESTTTLRNGNISIHLISPRKLSVPGAAPPSMVDGILAFNNDLIAHAQRVVTGNSPLPEIIHFHNWCTFPAAQRLGEIFQCPIVGTVHYISEPVERWWGQTPDREIVQQESTFFSSIDTIITVSHSMKRIIQHVYTVPAAHIHVIHNGMDFSPFLKWSERSAELSEFKQAFVPRDEKIILFAGRLNPMKGIFALLTSAAQVIEQYPNVRYLIVGEADSRNYMDKLTNLCRALSDKVIWLGKIPRKQLALLYQIADMVVIPSIYEPFGYVAIEAMAAGAPIVASNVGGLLEIIQHGQTGMLVPVHSKQTGTHVVDIEHLTASQLQLLGNEVVAKQLGKAARHAVLRKFDLEKMVQATQDVYRQIITHFRDYPNMRQEQKNEFSKRPT